MEEASESVWPEDRHYIAAWTEPGDAPSVREMNGLVGPKPSCVISFGTGELRRRALGLPDNVDTLSRWVTLPELQVGTRSKTRLEPGQWVREKAGAEVTERGLAFGEERLAIGYPQAVSDTEL